MYYIIQFISCFITFAFHLRRRNDASKLIVQLWLVRQRRRRSHAFPHFNPSQIGRSLSSLHDAVSYFRALFRCTFCTSDFGCRKCKKVQRLQMYVRTIAESTPRRQIHTCISQRGNGIDVKERSAERGERNTFDPREAFASFRPTPSERWRHRSYESISRDFTYSRKE